MIHRTAVIGAPAFSFFENGRHRESDVVAPSVILEQDVWVLPYCVVEEGTARRTEIRAGARLGAHVYIGHDAEIGRGVRIAAGARLCGWVVVEDAAYIGAGSVIRENVRVGAGSFVGAGAVVVDDVPPNCVVVGSPARFLRLRDPSGPDARKSQWNGEAWA